MIKSRDKLKSVLKNINSIALIGASANSDRDSFKVMEYLISSGYTVFPVNPNFQNKKILGRKCFSSLHDIKEKIDMVDIFRDKKFVMDITINAVKLGVKVIWTQEGIIDERSAKIAENAGIIFVMDECPMKVLKN